jgi:uncharacterized protein with GYD domain
MPLYLTRFSYTPETWARLLNNPEDRRQAAQTYIESVGGKLHGFWYAFGPHDGYTLWEAPDNVSMAAVALAIAAMDTLSAEPAGDDGPDERGGDDGGHGQGAAGAVPAARDIALPEGRDPSGRARVRADRRDPV